MLPRSYHGVIMWSEEQLRHISDHRAASRMRAMSKDFAAISDKMLQLLSGAPPAARASMPLLQLPRSRLEALFKAATCIIQSRSFGEFRLVPVLDMFNYSPHSNLAPTWRENVDGFTGYVVAADRDYDAGEEVQLFYGPKGNHNLIEMYGFALFDNPFNCAMMYVHLPFPQYNIVTLWSGTQSSSISTKTPNTASPACSALIWIMACASTLTSYPPRYKLCLPWLYSTPRQCQGRISFKQRLPLTHTRPSWPKSSTTSSKASRHVSTSICPPSSQHTHHTIHYTPFLWPPFPFLISPQIFTGCSTIRKRNHQRFHAPQPGTPRTSSVGFTDEAVCGDVSQGSGADVELGKRKLFAGCNTRAGGAAGAA